MKASSRWALGLLLSLLLFCAGCGGGSSTSTTSSGSGTVSGLKPPDQVSVVTAENSGARLKSLNFSSALDSAGTDYSTDEVFTFVYDDAAEPLQTVNTILCFIGQAKADKMVNKGDYLAMIDISKCEQGQNQSSAGTSGQSSTRSVKLQKMIANSSRASNTSDQIVKFWAPDMEMGPNSTVNLYGEITITDGVSSTNPFGTFTMNYTMERSDGTTFGSGTLQSSLTSTGQPRFIFYDSSGSVATDGFTDTTAANVVLDDGTGSGGTAHTYTYSDMGGSGATFGGYVLAFNSSVMLRGQDTVNNPGTTPNLFRCFSRSNFDTHVWRYNLYHAVDQTYKGSPVTAGQRVSLESGFPFVYTSGGNTYNGWIGYWGPWLETGGTLPDGASITRQTYGSSAGTDYTVNVAAGKLIRRAADTVGIQKLVGQKLNYFGPKDPTQPESTSNPNGDWQVEVNSSTYAFEITGEITSWSSTGPNITTVSPAVDITPSTDGETLFLWSDGLGGNITYVHDSTVTASNRTVIFYPEEYVYPDDSTLFPSGTTSVTLYCYDMCPKGGLTQADITAADPSNGGGGESDLFYATSSTPYTYTLTSSAGKVTLTDDTAGADVDFSSFTTSSLSALGHDWGIQSGEMVTSTSGISNPWDVYNQPVSYRWETGPNDWNKLVTVTDSSGKIATFDKPLQFTYTHSQANDLNSDATYAGQTFLLEYDGDGELSGFPWKENGSRWYPAFSIKDGVTLTDGTNQYAVKAVEMEQEMKYTNTSDTSDYSACTTGTNNLNVDTLFTTQALPGSSDVGTPSIVWADKPTVSDAPAVIGGVLQ